MLRDGQFIKEPPPKIGSHYVPKYYQTVLEGQPIEGESRWEMFYRKNISPFDVGAIMILMYVVIAVVVAVLREAFHLLFG
jgi:hypothetical protein